MLTVSISECHSGGKSWSHTARTNDKNVAVSRAIRKLFGRKAWFHRDSGLANLGMYGQVVEPAYKNPGANNCLTGRVRVTVE